MLYWTFDPYEFQESDLGQLRPVPATAPATATACAHRGADDDFFCLRFGVWYPSVDCAYRTLHRTCPGCLNCEQGRFNLKRHRPALRRQRAALGEAD